MFLETSLKIFNSCPFKGNLKVLFWKAGGLAIDKFIELKTIIPKESPDAIGTAESGSSLDNLRFFPLKG
ncbi:hypothetical protein TNCV_215271 [Trichonephila clavipes]|nr:hypothetical protein TNCV_215271 [Trichonephila clavipes]